MKAAIPVLIAFLFASPSGYSQQHKISGSLTKVKIEVEQINRMANHHKIYDAIALLRQSRRDFDTYVKHYFPAEYRNALSENPEYAPSLQLSFNPALTASYWEDRVKRAQRALDNARSAFSDRHHQRTLDGQDLTWTYLKTVYESAKTIKDVAESVTKQEYIDAFQNAKEGVDGFIENYIAIENAKLQILETQQYEMQVQSLIRRGERMEESNWQMASYFRAWEQDVDEYYSLISYFNSRVQQLKDTPSVNWDEDKFQWSPQPHLSQILQLREQFRQNEQDYKQIRMPIERLIEQAERDKDEVYRNLMQTELAEGQSRAVVIEQHFDEFYNRANDVLDECYEIGEKKSQSVPKQTVDDPEQNSGGVPESPPGQKQSNIYYHGYWIAKGGGERLNLIQEGHMVNYNDNLTGKATGSSAVFNETNRFGEQRTFELLLLNDGYKMKRRINFTDNDIKDILKRYKNISNPTADQIRRFRESDKSFHLTEFSYGGSSAVAFGGDEDRDGVADKFDKCPNTLAGYTLANGGVNIRGCFAGKRQEIVSSSEETSSADAGTITEHQSNNPGGDEEKALQDSFRNSGETIREETKKPGGHQQTNQKNLAGEVWTDCNGKGGYIAIPLDEMQAADQFMFKLISGEMEYVQVISRNNQGYWSTLYQGPRTTFRAGEFLQKLKPDITHLNFVVNSNHNSFRGSLPCRMELWHAGQGGSIPGIPPGSETDATADFDALLKKADEAFNKNYWDQPAAQPGMQPANPKQESIDILKKAAGIALQNHDPDIKYVMVKRLAEKYASFAKRVFAMSAKSDFIELAANFLNRADDIRRAYPNQQDYKKKSKAYLKFAEGWRSVTKSALWGNHQYNKMICDNTSKAYYDKALKADRNNAYLMRTVEKINAPKKPVPREALQLEEISPIAWNTAQDLMIQLNEGILEQASNVQENYLQIAETELSYSSGTVSIMRSGTKSWKVLPKNERTFIFVGDKIKTSNDVKGAYVYYAFDNIKLNLRNNAEITFWSKTKLLMKRGGAYLEVNKRGEEFLVITPTCAVGIRGTALEVDVHPHKSTKTYLYSGVVEVRNNSNVEYLTPGNAVEANPEQGVMRHSAFDAAARKRKLWNTPEPANRDAISKYDHDHHRHDLDLNRSQVTFKTYSLNDNQLSQKITNDLNGHVTPAGLQMRGNAFDIMYLNQDLFNISNWSMDWYNATSADEIKSGITSKMENGMMPMGFSSSNNRMYIFYAKGNLSGQGWQLIESSQNLQQVARDIEPYVSQDYLPVSISLYGQWYYTLLIRLPGSGFKTWAIQGYQTKKKMMNDIRTRAQQKQIPFGYLEEGGIHNVLYLGK